MRNTFFSLLLLLSLTLVLSQCPPETVYRRTLDGSCNNQSPGKEDLGSTFTFFIRTREGVSYVNNATGEAVEAGRPTPRAVSRALLQVGDAPINVSADNGLSLLAGFMGQFIAHDLALTPFSHHPDDMRPILLELDDPLMFSPFPPFTFKENATAEIPHRLGLHATVNGLREFYNNQTHWLDGSGIYYRDEEILPKYFNGSYPKFVLTEEWNVTLNHGQMTGTTVTLENILALVEEIGTPIETADPVDGIPVAGEERSAENALLNTIHLLFQREHNNLVDDLAEEHPTWNDTQLFEKARVINIAQYQHIIYKEFLPTLFGGLQMLFYLGPYLGYDEDVDPSVSHLYNFAGRWGHSTILERVPLYEDCGEPADTSRGVGGILPQGGQDGGRFTVMQMLGLGGGAHEMVKSLLYAPLERLDHLIHRNLREIAFGVFDRAGSDVAAKNINRARWNGIPGWDEIYSAWNGWKPGYKEIYGSGGCTSTPQSPAPDDLECFTSWMENATLANMTRELYGKVSGVDAWFAFLAEKKALGSSLGRTATKVILDQFKRLRDGDRFFYKRLPLLPVDPLFGTSPLTWLELFNVKQVTMASLLRRNFPELDPDKIQDSAFTVPMDGFFSSEIGC